MPASSSTNWVAIIAIGALILIALVVGVVLGRGRNRDLGSDDDRE